MELTTSQIDRILDIAEALQVYFLPAGAKAQTRDGREAKAARGAAKASGSEETGSRKRRGGKELVEFKKTLLRERKAGASVSELAQKYDVSSAYIYQLKPSAATSTKKRSSKKNASTAAAASTTDEA